MWIKSTSFNVWVRYFVWNFKGTLWNSTQNILPIHWTIWFLCNCEILRALRFKSSWVFLTLCICGPYNRPITKYLKLRIVHAPGMPRTFSPPPRVRDPKIHQGTCVTHVSWCMPITNGFFWSRWPGKHTWHSQRIRNLQCYVSGKRPMEQCLFWISTAVMIWLYMSTDSTIENAWEINLY